MKYEVMYAARAKRDLRDIYIYISENIQEPETAKKQIRRIMHAIRTLDEMPKRHRLYDDGKWQSEELRFLQIDNYLAFYLIDEPVQAVKIVRIVYGKRDIRKQFDE